MMCVWSQQLGRGKPLSNPVRMALREAVHYLLFVRSIHLEGRSTGWERIRERGRERDLDFGPDQSPEAQPQPGSPMCMAGRSRVTSQGQQGQGRVPMTPADILLSSLSLSHKACSKALFWTIPCVAASWCTKYQWSQAVLAFPMKVHCWGVPSSPQEFFLLK